MMTLIEKDKTLEDENESGEIFGEGILIGSEGIYDEDGTLIGNICGLRPCNLEMTSILNQISYQRYWICWISVDRPPDNDEIDMMTLIDNIRDTYPYNLEMISVLNYQKQY